MNEAFEDELEIDEARPEALPDAGVDTVRLVNRAGTDIDERRLLAQLGRLPHVTSLVVEPSSRVTSLRVLEAFPALETLELYGLGLRSLEGLDAFAHGRYLKVDTGRNRSRDLSGLAAAGVTKLWLRWARPGDVEAAIAGAATIRELTIASCPPLELGDWRRVALESLTLSGGTIEQLSDSAQIPTLRRLTLDHCRTLERLSGDNSGIAWMLVQGCDRLDFDSLLTCPKLEYLAVVGLGEHRIAHLSSAIAGAVVSNGSVSYVDGERSG